MGKTAVEWLKNELNQIKSSSTNMNGTIKFLETEFKELFKQAEEIEKQQQGYSEEEVNNIFYAICKHSFFEDNVETVYLQDVKDEFEQFKKK
jgi:hypothetical protein